MHGQEGETQWGSPFGARSLYALHVPFLDLGPANPELPSGGPRWSLESAYANSFSHSWHPVLFHNFLGPSGTPFRRDEAERIHHDFPNEAAWFVDADVLRSSLTGDFGLGSETFLSVEIPYVSHRAFTADQFVQDFHRVFGISQAGRDDFPKGAFLVMVQPAGGALQFTSDSPESGLGDLKGSISWRPRATPAGYSYGADVAVKAPTGSARNFNGSGGWDFGALFFFGRSGRLWRLEGEASAVVPGAWTGPIRIPRSPFARAFLSATRRLGSRTRIGASVTGEQSPFSNAGLEAISHIGAEVALGVERDFSRVSARMTVTEHLAAAGDRADVGLGVRLVYHPGGRQASR
jgi:hypothetical protein